MNHRERLRIFLKQKGLNQKQAGEILGYTPAMVSRYLNDLDWNWDFIYSLITHFPEIDWNAVFKGSNGDNFIVNGTIPDNSNLILIEDIERKLSQIKVNLSQK